MSAKKYKFVEVLWEDAASYAGWQSPSEDLPTVLCIHRGWLIEKTDEKVVLAAGLGKGDTIDNDVLGVQVIPRGMVKKIKKLKV